MERGTIILADSDPSVVSSAEALRDAGFKVIMAGDCQRTIEETLSRRVDLIVLDVATPQMGGVETCHCLKAMPKTAKVPVVLTASKKDPASKTLASRTHRSVRVLRKPFEPEDLVSLAKQVVRPKSLI
ncbi:MAG: response regulator [Rubrobacter sp.]|nr:response regulator [Rubrobacter sp.]